MNKHYTSVRSIISLLALIFFNICQANISFIDLKKIPLSSGDLTYLNEHFQYVEYWQMEWPYEINKSTIATELIAIHKRLSETLTDNIEQALLLGDIGHFLHNLDEQGYFEKAVTFYEKAISIDERDYRGYWFLANQYARGNVQVKSIEYFFKAEERLPDIEPANFWEDYSFAVAVANMPGHLNYAMDQARFILGEPSYFEKQLGATFKARQFTPHPDSTYSIQQIWTGTEVAENIDMANRPLGVKVLMDTTWDTRFFGYKNRLSFFTIVPEALSNDAGKDITYTIFYMIKVAEEGERLKDFILNIVKDYPEINEVPSPIRNKKSIAFELKDPEMYADIGGGHMQVIGLERSTPKYPGMLLEKPSKIKAPTSSEPTFYQALGSMDRFEGRIFYAIMLDTCDDIYQEASQVYYEVLTKRSVIE